MEKEWVRENGKIFTVCIFLYFQKNISTNCRQVEDIVPPVRRNMHTVHFFTFSIVFQGAPSTLKRFFLTLPAKEQGDTMEPHAA